MIGTPGRFCWRLGRFPPDTLSPHDRETWYHTHATDHVAYPQRPSRTFMAPPWPPVGRSNTASGGQPERRLAGRDAGAVVPDTVVCYIASTRSGVLRLWLSSVSETLAGLCGEPLSSQRWRYDPREGLQGPAVVEGFPRKTGQAYTRWSAISRLCRASIGFSPAQVIPPTRHNHNHCEDWKWVFVQVKNGSKLCVTHNAAREANISGD